MRITPYAVIVGLAVGVATAQPPATTQRTLDAAPLLDLATERGEVHVEGWDQPRVSFWAEHPPSIEIEIKRYDEIIEVRQHRSLPPSLEAGVVYRIRVPRRTALRIATIDSPVSVRGLAADVEVLTDRGAIQVQDVEGTVHADTTTAEITLSSIRGDVWLDATSGQVTLREATGNLTAQTESGPLSLAGLRSQRLSVSTGSGDVTLSGTPTAGDVWELASLSGDLLVELPPALSATVTVGTLSGEFYSDFGSGGSEPPRGESTTFDIGVGGGATLTLVTERGGIRLQRR